MSWLSSAIGSGFKSLKTSDIFNPAGAINKVAQKSISSFAGNLSQGMGFTTAARTAPAVSGSSRAMQVLKGAAAVGGQLLGVTSGPVSGLASALTGRRMTQVQRLQNAIGVAQYAPPMLQRRVFGAMVAHRRRGISATELRGFRKVTGLLRRVGMHPKGLGRGGRH